MKNKKIIPLTIFIVAAVLTGVFGLSRFFENLWQQPEQVDNNLSTAIPSIEILSPISTHCNVKTIQDEYSMADKNGVYSIKMLNNDCYNMIYSDFSTGSAEIMCTNIDCNHTDEKCTAYISKPGIFFTNNDKLFLVENSEEIFEISSEDYHRIAIAEFSEDYLYTADLILSNDQYFFTKVLCSIDNKYRIVAVSLDSGEITPLIEITKNRELVTAVDESIYVLEYADDDMQNECNILRYNVSSGKIEIMYTFSPENADYCFYKNSMVYMNKNDFELKKIDLSTGQEQTIKSISGSGDFAFRGLNDDYAVIQLFPEDIIVVDIKNGIEKNNQLTRFNLRAKCQEKLIPICVLENKIVFCDGGKTITLAYDYIGEQQTTIPYYAFITDDDFYNNIKNYTVMAF